MQSFSIKISLRSTLFLPILIVLHYTLMANAQTDNKEIPVALDPLSATNASTQNGSSSISGDPIDPRTWLLQQLRMAEATYDDLFLKQSIDKLVQINPNDPEAIKAEVYLNIRQNNQTQAQDALKRLKSIAPNTKIDQEASMILSLAQPASREQLQQARLLAASGQLENAKKAYDVLLNGVLPTLDLKVEYLQLMNRLSNEPSPVILETLTDLDRAYPNNLNLRLALVKSLFEQEKNDEAYDLLEKMSSYTNTRAEAAKLWQAHLKTLEVTPDSLAEWQRFNHVYTEENFASESQKEISRQQHLLADPNYQARLEGLKLIEKGEGQTAINDLKKALAATPEDPELLGALGIAYLRTNQRPQALELFNRAKALDKTGRSGNKWDRLIESTEYWLLLNDADQELKSGKIEQAKALYTKAYELDNQKSEALTGLGDVAIAQKNLTLAEQHYLAALKLEPESNAAISALVNLYVQQSPQRALNFINQLPNHHSAARQDQINDLHSGILTTEAEQLIVNQQIDQALLKLHQALKYTPEDEWLRYKIAKLYQSQGQNSQGDEIFEVVLTHQKNNPQFIYAYAMYLSSTERNDKALALLALLPKTKWSNDLKDLEYTIHRQQIIIHANQLRDEGDENAAIAYLKDQPAGTDTTLLIADWALLRQDSSTALTLYQEVLSKESTNQDAQLGSIEALVALQQQEKARQQLEEFRLPKDASLNLSRRYANAWAKIGEIAQAQALFDQLKNSADTTTNNDARALILRDAARVERQALNHQGALNDYKSAMVASGITTDPLMTDEVFTSLMGTEPDEDWLKRSIRSDAAEVYQQQMPTITVEHDYWGSSGTRGISDLKAHTTMIHMEHPWRDGRAFFRIDQVNMNAGRFGLSTPPYYIEDFGTCYLGCVSGIRQAQTGTSVALGWENDTWHFDIGTTPLGFEVQDWVGGISYSNQWKKIGWTLTASRRPVSSSLLSFAGAKDPGTGIRWGGARITGLDLDLSYDQGGKHGIWGNIGAHQITGRHIQNNNRFRLMAGYYYKLINEDHRRLSIGMNTMWWHYKYDASGYTLGQGGYYSPQQYFSLSLPISYRQRTHNWSFEVDTSISWSHSKTKDSDKYPMNLNWPGDSAGYCAQFSQCHIDQSRYTDFINDRTNLGSHGGGFGYTLRLAVERRLSPNWRLGTGINLQKSKDYEPSRAFLYLRYSLAPWQGDLDLAPQPLIPYADFK